MVADRTFVLIKHSAPVLEPDKAPNRWRLSEEGRCRCVVLADRLKRYGPGVVVSSEEPKARETARIAAGHLGVECRDYPGLHEHDRTGEPFLGDDEFHRKARAFFDNPEELVWGNETAEQARERFEGAVRSILASRQEGMIAIVAHGTVISQLVARHNDLDAYDLWKEFGLPSFCVLSAADFDLKESVPNLKA